MVLCAERWQAAQPGYMIQAVVGLTEDQLHLQLLCKLLGMSTIPRFQQCHRIWPLVPDHTGKLRETLFATSQDIVAEDAHGHDKLLVVLSVHQVPVSRQAVSARFSTCAYRDRKSTRLNSSHT